MDESPLALSPDAAKLLLSWGIPILLFLPQMQFQIPDIQLPSKKYLFTIIWSSSMAMDLNWPLWDLLSLHLVHYVIQHTPRSQSRRVQPSKIGWYFNWIINTELYKTRKYQKAFTRRCASKDVHALDLFAGRAAISKAFRSGPRNPYIIICMHIQSNGYKHNLCSWY